MDITPLNYVVIFLPVITLRPIRRMRLSALADYLDMQIFAVMSLAGGCRMPERQPHQIDPNNL